MVQSLMDKHKFAVVESLITLAALKTATEQSDKEYAELGDNLTDAINKLLAKLRLPIELTTKQALAGLLFIVTFLGVQVWEWYNRQSEERQEQLMKILGLFNK